MKSTAKKRVITLIVLGIIIGFSCFTKNYPESSMRNGDITPNYANSKLSNNFGKIHIINNSGWLVFRNAGNCSGEGTFSNPYVIEDLVIDGEGSGSCIWIENSNVFFKIENCNFYNSGDDGYNGDAGIKLYNVRNGMTIDSICSNSYFGVRLYKCENNTISGNDINNNNGPGILLSSSDNNIISGNIVILNNAIGISLSGSYNNIISGNNVNNNNGQGIYLSGGKNNTLSRNIISMNNHNGIRLGSSNNNNISGNIVNGNNEVGIFLTASNNNNICLNCFINVINAYDPGFNNYWDNGIKGNYWADYSGLDTDNDGIGDVPYNITGPAGSQDNFPLMECPISTQGGVVIPGYNILFLLGSLHIVVLIIWVKIKKSLKLK